MKNLKRSAFVLTLLLTSGVGTLAVADPAQCGNCGECSVHTDVGPQPGRLYGHPLFQTCLICVPG